MKPFTLVCMAFGVFGILFGCFGLFVTGLNAYSKTYQPKPQQVAPVSIPIPATSALPTYMRWIDRHTQDCLAAQRTSKSIVQESCNGSPEQYWIFDEGRLRNQTGICVGFVPENGKLIQVSCDDAPRGWTLVAYGNYETSGKDALIIPHGHATVAPLERGMYYRVQLNGQCLDVGDWSHEKGANVILYPCAQRQSDGLRDDDNQLWAKY